MPGFVKVVNDNALIFPERPGNKDASNLRNIIQNDQVSLIFVIPKTNDVLRVTGKAMITKGPSILEQMVSCGKPALLCIIIEVLECFFHCGRAFSRCNLWMPEMWPEVKKTFMHDQIFQQRQMNKQEIETLKNDTQAFLDEAGETDGTY